MYVYVCTHIYQIDSPITSFKPSSMTSPPISYTLQPIPISDASVDWPFTGGKDNLGETTSLKKAVASPLAASANNNSSARVGIV